MEKLGKKMLTRTRDKFLANIAKSIEELDKKATALKDGQATLAAQQLDLQNLQRESSSQIQRKYTGSTLYQISPEEVLVKTFSGAKIVLDPKDISVTPHLALDGVWEQDVTIAWLRALATTDTVLDIGANFGYYGLLAAQQTHAQKAKVVFFEANPKLIPYITKTLSVNNYYEHSNIENLAVAEKEGIVTLTVLKDYIGSSSLHSIKHLSAYVGEKIHLEASEIVKVPATTIDDYCKQHKIPMVDLIKMDIEGYEDKAYQGMRKTIKTSPRVTMFVEFTKDSYDDPRTFYKQLQEDFDTVYTIAPNGALVKPPATDYDNLIGKLDDWIMLVFTKNPRLAKDVQ
jgi:FkbM family methyltransferase